MTKKKMTKNEKEKNQKKIIKKNIKNLNNVEKSHKSSKIIVFFQKIRIFFIIKEYLNFPILGLRDSTRAL